MLSKLKEKVKESKLMLELKQREFYTKPSVKKEKRKLKPKLRHKKTFQRLKLFFVTIYLYIQK